jgi:hypothetical protein
MNTFFLLLDILSGGNCSCLTKVGYVQIVNYPIVNWARWAKWPTPFHYRLPITGYILCMRPERERIAILVSRLVRK